MHPHGCQDTHPPTDPSGCTRRRRARARTRRTAPTCPRDAKERGSALCPPKPPPRALLGPGAIASPGAADVPWSGGDRRLVIAPAGWLTPLARHSLARLPARGLRSGSFSQHIPPPPTWKNTAQLLACFQTNSEHPHVARPLPPALLGRGCPTAAGSESQQNGQDPAREPHALGQRPAPIKQEGSLLHSAPTVPPSLRPRGQARPLVLG